MKPIGIDSKDFGCCPGPVKKSACVIHLGNLQAVSVQGNTKKEAVVQAVNQFLI